MKEITKVEGDIVTGEIASMEDERDSMTDERDCMERDNMTDRIVTAW